MIVEITVKRNDGAVVTRDVYDARLFGDGMPAAWKSPIPGGGILDNDSGMVLLGYTWTPIWTTKDRVSG